MGIVLLPFLVVSVFLASTMLVMLIYQLQKTKDYVILLYGLIINCIEMFLLFLFLKEKNEVFVFTPLFNILIFFIIIPAIISLLFSILSVKSMRKIGLIFSSSVVSIAVLLLLYSFVFSKYIDLFDILGLKATY